MKRRCIRNYHSHRLGPYVVLKFGGVVIEKDSTLSEKCLTGPMIETKQFERTTARNNPSRIGANDKSFQNTPSTALRLRGQKLRNGHGYFHVHPFILSRQEFLATLKSSFKGCFGEAFP